MGGGLLTWLDPAVGCVYLAVAAATWRRSRRYGLLSAVAAAAWFAGEVSDRALLLHRPFVVLVALTFRTGRLPGRSAAPLVVLVGVAAVVAVPGSGEALTMASAWLVAVQAWLLRAGSRAGRGWADVRVRATWLVAAALGIPSAVRSWWPEPVQAPVLTALYDLAIGLAGLFLLIGALPSSSGETDHVIELSESTPEKALAALRDAVAGLDVRHETAIAVAMLERNAALHGELAARVEEARRSRERLVVAGVGERRRLERVLATGAGRHLDDLAGSLHAIRVAADPRVAELASSCLGELAGIRDDLAHLARGLHPRTLTGHGLAAALSEVAERSVVPIEVVVPDLRFPEAVETTLWYACSEVLANLTKHAAASRAVLEVLVAGGELIMSIADDGVGGARITEGGGLAGLVDRLAVVGGGLSVQPGPAGRGTRVEVRVPWP